MFIILDNFECRYSSGRLGSCNGETIEDLIESIEKEILGRSSLLNNLSGIIFLTTLICISCLPIASLSQYLIKEHVFMSLISYNSHFIHRILPFSCFHNNLQSAQEQVLFCISFCIFLFFLKVF